MVKSKESFKKVFDLINQHINEDSNITDVVINYQIKEPINGNKNYIKFNIKIDSF